MEEHHNKLSICYTDEVLEVTRINSATASCYVRVQVVINKLNLFRLFRPEVWEWISIITY